MPPKAKNFREAYAELVAKQYLPFSLLVKKRFCGKTSQDSASKRNVVGEDPINNTSRNYDKCDLFGKNCGNLSLLVNTALKKFMSWLLKPYFSLKASITVKSSGGLLSGIVSDD